MSENTCLLVPRGLCGPGSEFLVRLLHQGQVRVNRVPGQKQKRVKQSRWTGPLHTCCFVNRCKQMFFRSLQGGKAPDCPLPASASLKPGGWGAQGHQLETGFGVICGGSCLLVPEAWTAKATEQVWATPPPLPDSPMLPVPAAMTCPRWEQQALGLLAPPQHTETLAMAQTCLQWSPLLSWLIRKRGRLFGGVRRHGRVISLKHGAPCSAGT